MPPVLDAALLVLVAFYVVLWLTVWVHELGHVVFGRLAGYRPRSVGVGLTGRVLAIRIRGVIFFQCLGGFFGGVAFSAPPALAPDRWRAVVHLAGGMAANSLVAVAAAGIAVASRPGAELFWAAVLIAGVNALVAAGNTLPVQLKIGSARLVSDGTQIVAVLRRRTGTRYADVVNTVRGLTPFLARIGDARTAAALNAEVARYWALLGRPAFARGLLPGRNRPPEPYVRALLCYSEAWVEYAAGNTPAAADKLADAGVYFTAARDAAGLELVRLAWGELLLAAGRYGEAAAELNEPALLFDDTRQLLRSKAAALVGGPDAADAFLTAAKGAIRYDPVNRYAVCAGVPAAFLARGWEGRARRAEALLLDSFLLATAGLTDAADLAEKAAGFEALGGLRSVAEPVLAEVTKPAPSRNERQLSAAAIVAALGITIGACVCVAGMVLVIGPKADVRREPNPVLFLAGFAGLFGSLLWFAVRAAHWLVARYRPGTPPPAGSLLLVLAAFLAFVVPAAVGVAYQVLR